MSDNFHSQNEPKTPEDNIKKDTFNLFELSKYQENTPHVLEKRKTIESFSFSFCNWSGKLLKSLLNNIFYIGVCTECEYYLDNIEHNTFGIVRRYLMIEIPEEFIIDNQLEIIFAKKYLQSFLDAYIIHKKIEDTKCFIFDEFDNNSILSRYFQPDANTLEAYMSYSFTTERYFLFTHDKNPNNPFYNITTYPNPYIVEKDKNLETSISDFLHYDLSISIPFNNSCTLFPFSQKGIKSHKIFKNTFKSQFSVIAPNDQSIVQQFTNISFGFYERSPQEFFVWIKSEESLKPQPYIERRIVFASTKEECFALTQFSTSELHLFLKNKIQTLSTIYILELDMEHPNFHFFYVLPQEDRADYIKFLSLTAQEQILYRQQYLNEDFIHLNFYPFENILRNFQPQDFYQSFKLPHINSNHRSFVHTNFQKEHFFINKITGGKYLFNSLIFNNTKDSCDFGDFSHFFSVKKSEKVLIYQNEVIGFIQRQQLFPLHVDDFTRFKFHRYNEPSLNVNHFFIEDMIDKYECSFNSPQFFLDYIEFLDNNKTIYKQAILIQKEEHNFLGDAQLFLKQFSLKNNQNNS